MKDQKDVEITDQRIFEVFIIVTFTFGVNRDILGFKNEEEAFITTLMELLDNSIDAVVHNKKTPIEERSIVITVAESENANSIQIVDNGMSILWYFYECRDRDEL